MNRIIYKQDNGVVAVIAPTDEGLMAAAQQVKADNPDITDLELIPAALNLIAQKDVPTGKPYKIVDASEIPADRTERYNWTVNDADLTDGVGADRSTF